MPIRLAHSVVLLQMARTVYTTVKPKAFRHILSFCRICVPTYLCSTLCKLSSLQLTTVRAAPCSDQGGHQVCGAATISRRHLPRGLQRR